MTQPSKDATMDGEQRLTPRSDALFASLPSSAKTPAVHQFVGLARTLERQSLESAERIARLEGERDDARKWAAGWHDAVDTAATILELSHGLPSRAEFLADIQEYCRATSLALAEERRRVVELAGEKCFSTPVPEGRPSHQVTRDRTRRAIFAAIRAIFPLPDNPPAKSTSSEEG